MKSALANLCQSIGIQSASLLEAITTCLCSIAALGSLFVLEGWGMKMVGFVGFMALAYVVASEGHRQQWISRITLCVMLTTVLITRQKNIAICT